MQVRGEYNHAVICILLAPPEEEGLKGREETVNAECTKWEQWIIRISSASVWIRKPIRLSELVGRWRYTKSSHFLPVPRKYPSVYLAWRLFQFIANSFGL